MTTNRDELLARMAATAKIAGLARDIVHEHVPPEDRAALFIRIANIERALPQRPEGAAVACEQDDPRYDRSTGLYEKFRVERTNGSSGPGGKHEHCEYFVLDLTHDEHAYAALTAYATSCADDFPQLSIDLREIATAMAKREK